MHTFQLNNIDKHFKPIIQNALAKMDKPYLDQLKNTSDWLPGPTHIFNAFSLPLNQVKFVLLGESPYPRAESANGFAFWDAAVTNLWSDTGLSKPVNRATSLRNFIKMLLVARGSLKQDTSQPAIARVNKNELVKTNTALFQNLLAHGFLLLNTTLVFRPGCVRQDAKAWQPFIETVLTGLIPQNPTLLLFGKVAETVSKLQVIDRFKIITSEHPYNLSFVQNKDIINFFKSLSLLDKLIP